MLEFIGLLTCIYLAIKIFPSVVKFTVKLAVSIILIILAILTYFAYFPPHFEILIALRTQYEISILLSTMVPWSLVSCILH